MLFIVVYKYMILYIFYDIYVFFPIINSHAATPLISISACTGDPLGMFSPDCLIDCRQPDPILHSRLSLALSSIGIPTWHIPQQQQQILCQASRHALDKLLSAVRVMKGNEVSGGEWAKSHHRVRIGALSALHFALWLNLYLKDRGYLQCDLKDCNAEKKSGRSEIGTDTS